MTHSLFFLLPVKVRGCAKRTGIRGLRNFLSGEKTTKRVRICSSSQNKQKEQFHLVTYNNPSRTDLFCSRRRGENLDGNLVILVLVSSCCLLLLLCFQLLFLSG